MIAIIILGLAACKKVKFEGLSPSAVTPFDPVNTTKKQDISNYLTNIGNADSLIVGQMIGMGNLGDPNYAPEDFSELSKKPGSIRRRLRMVY